MTPSRSHSSFARIAVEELERRDTPTFVGQPPFSNGFGNADVFAVADFNGDTFDDLAIGVNSPGSGLPGSIQILLGDGTGAFATGQTLPLPIGGTSPSTITTFRSATTNHVGLAVAAFSTTPPPGAPGGTIVFDGDGTGNFVVPGTILSNVPARGIATGDFNGDGRDDLVSITFASGYQIFTQTAVGTFGITDANTSGLDFPRVVVGDFDGDSNDDFAGIATPNNELIVFYGAGNGTIAQAVSTVITSGSLDDLVAGDFNHDGTDDFVMAQNADVFFHQANANRTIDAAGIVIPSLGTTPGSNVEQLAVSDFDGDGDVDDVVAQDESGDSRVAYATTGGNFTGDAGNPYPPAAAGQSGSVAEGDFNGDGAFDFIVTNFTGRAPSAFGLVYLNVIPTTTTVVDVPDPSTFGNAVTFTATVQPTFGTAIPTGTITFTIDGNPQAPIPMTNGQASLTINTLGVGTHTVLADYSGAETFGPSRSPLIDHTVNPANSTTTVAANPNPATYGDTVALTATVGSLAGPGASGTTPTGTVTFLINGNVLGPFPLTGNTATTNVPGLQAGTYPVTATYSGDGNFNGSTGSTTLVVERAPTTTTMTPPNGPVPPGQPLSVNVLVAGAGQNPGPTGQVELVDQDNGAVLGVATLDPANGTATIVVNNPPSGPRTVFVRYLGNTNFLTSTSTPAAILVQSVPVILAGSDHGAAICLFGSDPNQRGGVNGFGPGFTGVRPAAGDFNQDGFTDVLVGSAPGDPSRVALMDGRTRQHVASFSPFGDGFTGGVFVAAGDINNDGRPDIAVSADAGGGSRVRVFLNTTAGFTPVADFLGIEDDNFRGGTRVAIGDVNRDGFADVIVSAGPGGGARIAGYNGQQLTQGRAIRVFADFFAFDPTSRIGAYVAAGDVNGDGFAEIVVGADAGGGPRVTVIDGAGIITGGQIRMLANFFAGPSDLRGGIRVAVRDFNTDGFADVITGPGGTDGSRQKIFNGADVANGNPTVLLERDPFPGLFFGIYVA